MKPNEMIEVLKAFERGEEIQFRKRKYDEWSVVYEPTWNFFDYSYRIKPKFPPEQEEIIKADKEGKQIQFNTPTGWEDRELSQGDFRFDLFRYRIKPEPREFWFIKSLGSGPERYGWTKHSVRQEGVDYLEQIHVREVID